MQVLTTAPSLPHRYARTHEIDGAAMLAAGALLITRRNQLERRVHALTTALNLANEGSAMLSATAVESDAHLPAELQELMEGSATAFARVLAAVAELKASELKASEPKATSRSDDALATELISRGGAISRGAISRDGRPTRSSSELISGCISRGEAPGTPSNLQGQIARDTPRDMAAEALRVQRLLTLSARINHALLARLTNLKVPSPAVDRARARAMEMLRITAVLSAAAMPSSTPSWAPPSDDERPQGKGLPNMGLPNMAPPSYDERPRPEARRPDQGKGLPVALKQEQLVSTCHIRQLVSMTNVLHARVQAQGHAALQTNKTTDLAQAMDLAENARRVFAFVLRRLDEAPVQRVRMSDALARLGAIVVQADSLLFALQRAVDLTSEDGAADEAADGAADHLGQRGSRPNMASRHQLPNMASLHQLPNMADHLGQHTLSLAAGVSSVHILGELFETLLEAGLDEGVVTNLKQSLLPRGATTRRRDLPAGATIALPRTGRTSVGIYVRSSVSDAWRCGTRQLVLALASAGVGLQSGLRRCSPPLLAAPYLIPIYLLAASVAPASIVVPALIYRLDQDDEARWVRMAYNVVWLDTLCLQPGILLLLSLVQTVGEALSGRARTRRPSASPMPNALSA